MPNNSPESQTAPPLARIALFGNFQVGKSSLFNCLCGEFISPHGDGMVAQTREPRRHTMANGTWELVDVPGFNSNAADEAVAERWINECTHAILVLENRMISESLKKAIRPLAGTGKVIALMNCDDANQSASPEHPKNCDLATDLTNQLDDIGIRLDHALIPGVRGVVPVNIYWRAFSLFGEKDVHPRNPSQKLGYPRHDDGLGPILAHLAPTDATVHSLSGFRNRLAVDRRLRELEGLANAWMETARCK